jgi:acyl CoA:acetate/3-ketoacid CoA transferase beta subunit
LIELAEGVTVEEIKKKTEAPFKVVSKMIEREGKKERERAGERSRVRVGD